MSGYYQASGGHIVQVGPCPNCKGTKGLMCRLCQGRGILGADVTCLFCTPLPAVVPFDKDCPICRGSGIKNYSGSIPPIIQNEPWWK